MSASRQIRRPPAGPRQNGPPSPPSNSPARRGLPFVWLVVALVAVALILVLVRLPWSSGERDAGPTAAGRGHARPSPAAALPPPCSNGDLLAPFSDYRQWDRTLLDTTYGLLPTYQPPDLVSVTRAGFAAPAGLWVRDLVIRDLSALRRDAAIAGHPIAVEAAYRSYAQQTSLIHRRRNQLGQAEALSRTARPGHSEHQLGTTVDFKSFGAEDVTQGWGSTPTGRWMQDNAWRYGFVMSYPRAEVALTCYAYEPWHFRYLGRPAAGRVHASGLPLRQYLWNQARAGS